MNIIFWISFLVDIAILLVAVWGKGFRTGFGAGTGFNVAVITVLIILLGGGFVLKYGFKLHTIATIVVSVPILILLLASLFGQRNA